MIVLDTHTLFWLATDDAKLGPLARGLIERAIGDDGVAVSAISYWELAMLAERGRIAVDDISDLRRAMLDADVAELPIDGAIAILAAQLDDLHKDPADRFIAATAIRHAGTLVTADERLLAGPATLQRFDARQ